MDNNTLNSFFVNPKFGDTVYTPTGIEGIYVGNDSVLTEGRIIYERNLVVMPKLEQILNKIIETSKGKVDITIVKNNEEWSIGVWDVMSPKDAIFVSDPYSTPKSAAIEVLLWVNNQFKPELTTCKIVPFPNIKEE